MNSVNLIGRLTRDPDLRYTQSGMAVARFTLAVDRRISRQKRQEMEANNQQTADFVSCTAWGQMAELIANYVKKGHRLAVMGRIQTGSYERDGRTVYTTDVVVENIDFLESQQSNQMNRAYNQNQSNAQSQNFSGPTNSAYNNSYNNDTGSFGNDISSDDEDGFYPINNEDIPF